MENRALFFRNVNNIHELREKTEKSLKEAHKKQKFEIIGEKTMSESDFADFQNHFNCTWDFIKNETYKLTMNNKAEYLCILVKTNNQDFGILVNSAGYTYARNVAMIRLNVFREGGNGR